MQILLVEDDLALAQALCQALQAQGYTANTVDSGKAALVIVATECPDIVILDLGLPDMDGIEVLKRIRKTQRKLPVLVLQYLWAL